ncbi:MULTISPECIES: 3-oxoacyl-[acyl-carrier-protein] reductase [Streptomyces]|uniref:3-oxoacyl-[acyl-carrier-protein] reductase n=1 Tax=Streptomyces TaxID=1883 RepID=UPI00074694E6|nr:MULTISPECIES: 3-oxoacyl-[acyl-carrier-protein] reductase [Streptomyces]KUL72766.1 3-oxoacyl-ACP reductase [Streptomyces sp. NRRL WC-3605]KUL75862.1 3-oxoacyl-ACP reductase [Streptomyces sp. NRRL WC-3604]
MIALVSGGSRGIGRAIVTRLAQDGYDVAFCYRSDEDAAERLTKEAAEHGTRVTATRCDVADADDVRDWYARTERELGPVDAAVTSAGITRDRPLVLMPEDDWNQVLRTNLDGVYHVCRAAAFSMSKRRSGAIVNLSSVAGVYGNAGQANYAASKAGIIGFTKSLAKECGPRGVRVNVVAPGLIETDMVGGMPEAALQRQLKNVALGRLGRPEEVADLVSFLVSERAAYITGSVLEIHGGGTF